MTPEEQLETDLARRPRADASTDIAAGRSRIERVRIVKGDGRVVELGRPGTLAFRWRLFRYRRSL